MRKILAGGQHQAFLKEKPRVKIEGSPAVRLQKTLFQGIGGQFEVRQIFRRDQGFKSENLSGDRSAEFLIIIAGFREGKGFGLVINRTELPEQYPQKPGLKMLPGAAQDREYELSRQGGFGNTHTGLKNEY